MYPLTPGSDVSTFRVLAGDSEPASIDGDSGTASFALWSDAEIEVYLGMEPGNIYRAVALGYRALAGNAASQSKMVKDYDLEVDLTRRAGNLLDTAREFDLKADQFDEERGLRGDFFVLIDPNLDNESRYHQEAAPDAFLL